MDHDQLLGDIGALAAELGVWWIHLPGRYYGRGSWKGFPDLLLLGPCGLLFAEIKTGGVLEPAQQAWRDRLTAAGVQWRLWQPADWYTGKIRAELARISGTR